MRRLKMLSLLSALAFVLTGCMTIEESRLADGALTVDIEASGWYVLGFIPIVTADADSWWPYWFRNNTDTHMTMKALDRILEREKAVKVGPIVSREIDENILLVFLRVTFHTSAIVYSGEKEK